MIDYKTPIKTHTLEGGNRCVYTRFWGSPTDYGAYRGLTFIGKKRICRCGYYFKLNIWSVSWGRDTPVMIHFIPKWLVFVTPTDLSARLLGRPMIEWASEPRRYRTSKVCFRPQDGTRPVSPYCGLVLSPVKLLIVKKKKKNLKK